MKRFLDQQSPEPEQCTRCVELGKPTIIRPGETFWALLDSEADADAPPRILFCDPCRRFIRAAMTRPRRTRH